MRQKIYNIVFLGSSALQYCTTLFVSCVTKTVCNKKIKENFKKTYHEAFQKNEYLGRRFEECTNFVQVN